MRDTFEEMDIEIEQRGKKIEVLESKIGLPECKVIEEMNRLRLKQISSKRKGDRIMDGCINSHNNHKYIKNKKR